MEPRGAHRAIFRGEGFLFWPRVCPPGRGDRIGQLHYHLRCILQFDDLFSACPGAAMQVQVSAIQVLRDKLSLLWSQLGHEHSPSRRADTREEDGISLVCPTGAGFMFCKNARLRVFITFKGGCV